MNNSTNNSKKRLPLILIGILVLILLNMNSKVHGAIIYLDIQTALAMNSIIDLNPVLDKTIGWLSTKMGDVFVISCLCFLFLLHAWEGTNPKEIIRRLSFWGWVGLLCLITYAATCAIEEYIKRDIPLLVIHQLKNLQTIYHLKLRTSAAYSFPSGHALAYIFFALMAWRRYLSMSLFIGTLGIIMLAVRLSIGVHWLSDIVLGSLPLSILLAALATETPLKKTYFFIQKVVAFYINKITTAPVQLHTQDS